MFLLIQRQANDVFDNHGDRITFKHKNRSFWELTEEPALGERAALMNNCVLIAKQWVTAMRARHVLDQFVSCSESKECPTLQQITTLVDMLVQDLRKESVDEIDWNVPDVEKQLRKQAGKEMRQLILSQQPQ